MPTCRWAVHPGTETLCTPRGTRGWLRASFQGEARGNGDGRVFSGMTGCLCPVWGCRVYPGRRKWELRGWGWSGVGERSGAECLLPSVPQTLHPARGWLFPQSVLSCVSVCGGRAREGRTGEHLPGDGSPHSPLLRIPPNPGPLHSLDLRPQDPNNLVQPVASRMVFVCLFPKEAPSLR